MASTIQATNNLFKKLSKQSQRYMLKLMVDNYQYHHATQRVLSNKLKTNQMTQQERLIQQDINTYSHNIPATEKSRVNNFIKQPNVVQNNGKLFKTFIASQLPDDFKYRLRAQDQHNYRSSKAIQPRVVKHVNINNDPRYRQQNSKYLRQLAQQGTDNQNNIDANSLSNKIDEISQKQINQRNQAKANTTQNRNNISFNQQPNQNQRSVEEDLSNVDFSQLSHKKPKNVNPHVNDDPNQNQQPVEEDLNNINFSQLSHKKPKNVNPHVNDESNQNQRPVEEDLDSVNFNQLSHKKPKNVNSHVNDDPNQNQQPVEEDLNGINFNQLSHKPPKNTNPHVNDDPNQNRQPIEEDINPNNLSKTNPKNDKQPNSHKVNSYNIQNKLNQASRPEIHQFKQHTHHKLSHREWIRQELKAYHSNLNSGMKLYDSLDYQGQRYLKTVLTSFSWNKGLVDKIAKGSNDFTPRESKSIQKIRDVANNVKRSFNDNHIIGKGKSLDANEKKSIDIYLKKSPKQVIKNNLLKYQLKSRNDKKAEIAFQRREILTKSIKDQQKSGALAQRTKANFVAFKNMSRAGKQYMQLNTDLAGSDYLHYLPAKKEFDRLYNHYATQGKFKKIPRPVENQFEQTLPWSMRRKFGQMNDLRGGFRTGFHRMQQVPQVSPKEANMIDNFVEDSYNNTLLASGSLARQIRKYGYHHSDKVINRQESFKAKKLSPKQVEPVRQFFLSLRPRSRRYLGAIARYAGRNYQGMLRVVGNTPREQLTQQERRASERLYGMSHGKKKVTNAYGKTYWIRAGNPLPIYRDKNGNIISERTEIRKFFLNPGWQPYFANGKISRIVNVMNNGNHKNDKYVLPHTKNYNYKVYYHSLLHGQKLYNKFLKKGDFQGAKYLTTCVREYALHTKSFERELYAHESPNGNPKDLSIHERNDWRKLQAIIKGQTPDDYGNLIQTGQPAPAGDKEKVDSFLKNPRNTKMLRDQRMQKALVIRKNLNQKYNLNQPHQLGASFAEAGKALSSILTTGGNTLGQSFRTLGSYQGDRNKAKFSRSRLGGGREMRLHDLQRDKPGMDR